MSNAPICEDCGIQMVERTNKATGKKFYGCKKFPHCRNTEEHEDNEDHESYFDTLS